MSSSETIRPVYLLWSGLDSSCLDIMPFDILSSLQSQIIRVLSKLDSDDHLASVSDLDVSVTGTIARASSKANSSNSQTRKSYII